MSAQTASEKVHRIGILSGGTVAAYRARHEAFLDGMRELGYVEGRNIALEVRYAEGRPERVRGLAGELVKQKVDVILTYGDRQVRAVQQATRTLPVVVGLTGDLVAPGYATSLARPGGNVTGLITQQPETAAKRLELLKAAFPKISRVGFVLNLSNELNVAALRAAQAATHAQGVSLVTIDVHRAEDIDSALQAALDARVDALLVSGDTLLITFRARVVGFAARQRLPAMYGTQDFMDVGGLMFYGANVNEMFRRAAVYVDRILKGAAPADLPIEQPTKFELIVNTRTAKASGLTIPQAMLLRADRVIQ